MKVGTRQTPASKNCGFFMIIAIEAMQQINGARDMGLTSIYAGSNLYL